MHISDLFTELFAFVTETLAGLDLRQPAYQELRENVARLLEPVGCGDFSPGQMAEAKFAACAWVDERVAESKWQHKGLWLREPFQRICFDTTQAGEEFFQRLERLGPQQTELREIYYLCLALGFKGKFCAPGDELRLEQLKRELLASLPSEPGSGAPEGTAIFPESAPASSPASAPGRRPHLSWLGASCLFGPLLLFAILFLLYRFTLTSVGDNFLKAMGN